LSGDDDDDQDGDHADYNGDDNANDDDIGEGGDVSGDDDEAGGGGEEGGDVVLIRGESQHRTLAFCMEQDQRNVNFTGLTSHLAYNYDPAMGPYCEYVWLPHDLYEFGDTNLYIPIRIPRVLFFLFLGNAWDQLRHSSNIRFHIGTHQFNSTAREGFTQANNCRDVLAALHLMFHLQLESYNVGPDQSRIHDDLMLAIKESSRPQPGHQPINLNSFGKVNKAFCRFVIDFLAVQLVFDNGFSFTAQVAPSPYATNDYNNHEVMKRVWFNQRLLIWLVTEMEPVIAQQLLLDRGQPYWESPNLKTVFSQAQAYVTKWRKGIISSWAGYNENQYSKCLWIHHWVILQFIHPFFCVRFDQDLSDDCYATFKHDNWTEFISVFDPGAFQNYADQHADSPRFRLLWLGRRI
jgi:hypothetical protein